MIISVISCRALLGTSVLKMIFYIFSKTPKDLSRSKTLPLSRMVSLQIETAFMSVKHGLIRIVQNLILENIQIKRRSYISMVIRSNPRSFIDV